MVVGIDSDLLLHTLTLRKETDHLRLVILSVSEESRTLGTEILRFTQKDKDSCSEGQGSILYFSHFSSCF